MANFERICLFGFVLVVFGNVVYADTITVPGDYPTIQTAIGAASASDTVIVAAGIYTENISSVSEVTLHFTGTATINGLVTTGVGTDIISDDGLTIISASDITLGGPVTVGGILELHADGNIEINSIVDALEIEMTASVAIYINAPVNGTVSVDMQAGSDVTGIDLVTGADVSIGWGGGTPPVGFATIYVDDSAVGANDGSSWDDAFNEFYDALNIAEAGDKIFVAQGTYLPDTTGLVDPREAAFQMKNVVTIKGGYAGYGAAYPDERNVELYETVLSGNIGNTNNKSDNCYHVFYHPDGLNLDFTAVLDGVTITAGYAIPPFIPLLSGGGMYNDGSSPTVTNCIFTHNAGGGMQNENSSPKITDCAFIGNAGINCGGGITNWNSNPTLTNCTFSGNLAGTGGGIQNRDSSPTVTNCTFIANSANVGGGIYNDNSSPEMFNCTFTHNGDSIFITGDDYGGGMYNSSSNPTITNCIFWGNTATNGDEIYNNSSVPVISYCDIAGCLDGVVWDPNLGFDGGGNIDVDPLFIDANGADDIYGTEDDNLRLQAGSLCIDAGDNGAATVATDLDRIPRVIDGDGNGTVIVDMGAYEYHEPAVIYVDDSAVGADDGSSWDDAFNELYDALDAALPGDKILVAVGRYLPDTTGLFAPRNACFQMKNGVAIEGGYAGSGAADPNERNIELYETILSGDLLDNDAPVTPAPGPSHDTSRNDNCYQVFYHPTGTNLDATAVLDGFTITAGYASGEWQIDEEWQGSKTYGGGMYNEHSSPTVANCTFSNGSGMLNSDNSNPIVNNCIFTDNRGGGMYNRDNSSPTVTDSTFNSNGNPYAVDIPIGEPSSGGSMSNKNYCSPIVTNCTFTDNKCGIYNAENSNPAVTNCTFTNNKGSGMYNNNSNPTVIGCTFTDNTNDSDVFVVPIGGFSKGGGGGMYNWQSNPTVANCTFTGNSTTSHSGGSGGGMFNYQSSPAVTNCIFKDNSAANGGGMGNGFDSNPIVSNCMFIGNSVAWFGGGMANFEDSSPIVSNCIFNSNSAGPGPSIDGSGRGGGMANFENSNPEVINCTFTGNSVSPGIVIIIVVGANTESESRGSGMYNSSSSSTITNCIFWGNSESSDVDEILLEDSSAIDVNYCDVKGGQAGIHDDGSGNTINWGSGNIDVDPMFVDPNGVDGVIGTEDDNLRLMSDSPCIDTGDPNYIAEPNETDLDGRLRIIGDRIDMGAYEFVARMEVAMKITPQTLNINSNGKWVKAHFVLPEEFEVDDVDADSPAKLWPFGIDSNNMDVFVNEDGLVEVEAAFDRAELCSNGFFDGIVTVEGLFADGNYFYGTDTIKIIDNAFVHLAGLAYHWLEADCGWPDWCDGFDFNHNSKVDLIDYAEFAGQQRWEE